MERPQLLDLGQQWFASRGWQPMPFQLEAWHAFLDGKHGIVNAPTGSGKTYSLLVPAVLSFIAQHPQKYQSKTKNGLQVIWLSPIRALTQEISLSARRLLEGLGLPWEVGIRTGDTPANERARQKRRLPEILITTPESLHLMLASKGYANSMRHLKVVVADEWHELMGSKRAVQVELALCRLKHVAEHLRIWGISATIGNMDEALQVLLGSTATTEQAVLIKSGLHKEIKVRSVLPETIERFPWAGHYGIHMLHHVLPIINASQSTLIFTNTRAQAEIWYQRLLEVAPELSGLMALHHGSVERELRNWVEEALHEGRLKAVVCTSSLDLGVDFRPVETIIQVGGPKGIARFMQRAGRSGHQPGAASEIWFLPTHTLELIEAAALRQAIEERVLEDRIPFVRSFDVLIQYLVTLAVSDGFEPACTFEEVKTTYSYNSLTDDEWYWVLQFIHTGGEALNAYDEYQKVNWVNGRYVVESRRIAMRHRLSIGTIVSSQVLHIKYMTGGRIGTVEEWFVSWMKPGDVFWFAGRSLEFVKIHNLDVLVRRSKATKGKVPSWQGGRMPLSSQLGDVLRRKMTEALHEPPADVELQIIKPLIDLQQQRSAVPSHEELLIEKFTTKEGVHLLCYPFEGRFVHEGMAYLLAWRLSKIKPISFSIAFNDYGFELLSDQDVPIEEGLETDIFTDQHLLEDIQASVDATELARKRFRDIAQISGLVFSGFPGKYVANKHLQSSSQLFFDVFQDYDPENLLLNQAYQEVMEFQLEENRMRKAFDRINHQRIIVTYPVKPTPFAFPIMVDRLRERFTSEKLEDRIKKMTLAFE